MNKKPNFDDPELGYERLANDPVTWLAQARLPDQERSPWFDRGRYPQVGTVRDHYLDPANKLEPSALRDVLRALLPDGSGLVGSDHRNFEYNADLIVPRVMSGDATEYERRLLRSMVSTSKSAAPAPVPDLSWVIDVAFHKPAAAFAVADAFLSAHFRYLNDQVIDGLYDFMATITCHFGIDSAEQPGVAVLRALRSRDLEFLAAALWSRLGYQTTVTKATHDGGRDVIARRTETGRIETTLIECKQLRNRVAVDTVRAFNDVVTVDHANKGVIIAPGGFTTGAGSATEWANSSKTTELIDGVALARLMTEHYGPGWPQNVTHYIDIQRRTQARRSGRSQRDAT